MEEGRRNDRNNEKSSRKKRAIIASTIAGIIVCVIIYALLLIPPVKSARENLQSGQSNLMAAYTQAVEGKIQDAAGSFKKAETELGSADAALNSGVFFPLQIIPIASNNLKAARNLTKAGYHIAVAGGLTTEAFLQGSDSKTGANSGINKLDLFNKGQINFAALNSLALNADKITYHMNYAAKMYGETPKNYLLTPISEATKKFGQKIPQLRQASKALRAFAGILPGFLGGNGNRSYFLAIQNNAELRATGGLIGNYGIVTFAGGKILMNEFNEIHALQKPNLKPVSMPKEFMARYGRYNSNGMWLNVNMSPDFPTTGYLISKLYENATGRKVDGVITIDPVALKYILEVMGPVTVVGMDGRSTTIDSDNVIDETLVKAYEQFAERSDRKNYLAEVAMTVWFRMITGDFDITGVAKKMAVAFEEKHMAIYSKYADEQKLIEELGYGGSIKKTDGDYLQVLMQNHGANKLDIYTHQMIDYNITIDKNNSAQVVAKVSIENGAQPERLPDYVAGDSGVVPRGYSNIWLNLFAPKGTQLIKTTLDGRDVLVEVGHEKDRAVFSQYVKVKPGTQSTVSFTYNVPNVVTEGKNGPEYNLNLQTQPVINPPAVSLTIKSPKGFTEIPKLCTKEGNVASYQSWVTKDTQFKFKLAGSN
jgi:hypothetical protein